MGTRRATRNSASKKLQDAMARGRIAASIPSNFWVRLVWVVVLVVVIALAVLFGFLIATMTMSSVVSNSKNSLALNESLSTFPHDSC